MYGTNHFKKGLKILIEGKPFVIIDFEHFKPGKGNQFTRTKLKNLVTGQNIEKTVKSGEKFNIPDVEYVNMVFLYKDDNGYNFMNNDTFDQTCLSHELMTQAAPFMIDNMEVKVCLFNNQVVGVELPASVVLKVKQTEPGFKGNTVSNTNKPATLETGHIVQVPLHINEGDSLKIDTRTGEYRERVQGHHHDTKS